MARLKADIETSLQQEKKMIENGELKEDSPLDTSENFVKLCEACRRGDIKECQEVIQEGANINARDQFDYTPLILASLCGRFEIVQLLLESGALCERDTFQGERCLYNALTDRIRKLLLEYDYSKSTDPLQPFAAHVTSLLYRSNPQTSDILVTSADEAFRLHKFVLSARSPYFGKKLATSANVTSWKLPSAIPPQSFDIAIRYLYFGEIPNDLRSGPGTGFTEEEVLEGLDKISKQLEIRSLWESILGSNDRRLARQRRTTEIEKGRDQFEQWFSENILKYRVVTTTEKAPSIQWDRDNNIFADILLRADEPQDEEDPLDLTYDQENLGEGSPNSVSIPVGPYAQPSRPPSHDHILRKSVLFPAHRAMLLRSEYFQAMFASSFREARNLPNLQIVTIECSPPVLEIVLSFLYTENTRIPIEHAVEVLYIADQLFIEKLKTRAVVTINTIGSGNISMTASRIRPVHSELDDSLLDETTPDHKLATEGYEIDVYAVLHASWLLRIPRLEEFCARYFAYRLELFIDTLDFANVLKESANRIDRREETDTIELLDDIRFYLSERFRLRFEDVGMDEMMAEQERSHAELPASQTDSNFALNFIQKGEDGQSRAELQDRTSGHETSITDQQKPGSTMATTAATLTPTGEIVADELGEDARNYQMLLEKIDLLLESLKLDA